MIQVSLVVGKEFKEQYSPLEQGAVHRAVPSDRHHPKGLHHLVEALQREGGHNPAPPLLPALWTQGVYIIHFVQKYEFLMIGEKICSIKTKKDEKGRIKRGKERGKK